MKINLDDTKKNHRDLWELAILLHSLKPKSLLDESVVTLLEEASTEEQAACMIDATVLIEKIQGLSRFDMNKLRHEIFIEDNE